jgi:hypothetical protein
VLIKYLLMRGIPIVGHFAVMLVHSGGRRHAVKQFVFPPVLLGDFAAGLIVAGEYSSDHAEIRPRSECFGHVAWRGAATIL